MNASRASEGTVWIRPSRPITGAAPVTLEVEAERDGEQRPHEQRDAAQLEVGQDAPRQGGAVAPEDRREAGARAARGAARRRPSCRGAGCEHEPERRES